MNSENESDELSVLFKAMVQSFGENQLRLEQALNIMSVVLIPPNASQPLPSNAKEALRRWHNTTGSSEEEKAEVDTIFFSDAQTKAIQTLIDYAKNNDVDQEKAQSLIEQYSSGGGAVIPGHLERGANERKSGGGRRGRSKSVGRKSRKGSKGRKSKKAMRGSS